MEYKAAIDSLKGLGLVEEIKAIQAHVSALENIRDSLNDAYNRELEISGTSGKARDDREKRVERMNRLEPNFRMYLWAYKQVQKMTAKERNEKRKELESKPNKRIDPIYRAIKSKKFTSDRPVVDQVARYLADVDTGEQKSINTYREDVEQWFSN